MRPPPNDDRELWRRAMRDVAPLPGRSQRLLPNPLAPAAAAESGGRLPAQSWPGLAPLPPLERQAGVDRATAQRLSRGRYPVEGVLDLHGMMQAEAHRALVAFLDGSRAAGRRCVVVVTGHGRTSGGVLKAAVPRWLDEPELRRHVLAIAPARPQHGGGGALYVLLRRPAR